MRPTTTSLQWKLLRAACAATVLLACGDDEGGGTADGDTAGDTDTVAPDTDTSAPDSDTDTSAPDSDTDTSAPDSDTDTTPPDTDVDEPDVTPGELAISRGDQCAALVPFAAPALPFSDDGDTTGASDDYIYTTGDACGGPAGQGILGDASPDLVYAITPGVTATYHIAVTPADDFDPALMLTDACPPIGEDGFDALTCLGVSDAGEGADEVLLVELTGGKTYYLLVDGWSNDAPVSGTFALSFAIGEDCGDGEDDDGNGATDCEDAQCADDARCDESRFEGGCTNGSDDDGDGASDCADDDCADALACDEATAGGCDNDVDDEEDGLTDCADPDCDAAPTCDESTYSDGCANGDDDDGDGRSDCDDPDCGRVQECLVFGETCEAAVTLMLDVAVEGTTNLRTSEYGTTAASCRVSTRSATSFGASAPDAAYIFAAPAAGAYVFETVSDFDDALTVTSDCAFGGGLCFGVERQIAGGERVLVELAASETVYVIVDGFSNASDTNTGDFSLSVRRATEEVAELVCDDAFDGDGDGDVDCDDADCAFDTDFCVELGHCTDGVDNDADEAVDCDDLDCRADIVACPPPPGDTCTTPLELDAVEAPVELDTCEFGVDYIISGDTCIAGTGDSPDAVASFTAPAAGHYVVELEGVFDTILNVVRGDACPAPALDACDGSDDSSGLAKVSIELARDETVWLVVTSYEDFFIGGPGCGDAVLTVYEVDAETCDDETDNDRDDFVDCEDDDCAAAPTCNESANGAAACRDGDDNDEDGVADCFDRDCAGTSDCPDGVPGDTCSSPLEADALPFRMVVDTCNYGHDYDVPFSGNCAGTSTSSDPTDVVARFEAPAAGDYRVTFDLGVDGGSSFDAVLNVVGGDTCPVAPLTECLDGSDDGDPEGVNVTAAAAGDTFWIIAGGYGGGCGLSALSIIELGPEQCTDGADNDGDRDTDCEDSDCAGDASCIERCDDGKDNDVDGNTDCEDDDCDETPSCNESLGGANACRDGDDNDADGLVDCYDGDCGAAAACPGGAVGDTCASAPTVDEEAWSATFGTCDYTNDYARSSGGGCSTMGSAGDVVVKFVAPTAGEYRATFTGGALGTALFDSVLNVVRGGACPTAPTTCAVGADDGGSSSPAETVTFTAAAGETLWVLADGYSSGCGIATLDIVMLAPEVCDDGVDNDGDGDVDCADSRCRETEPALCPSPAGELCGETALPIAALPFEMDTADSCSFAKDYEGDEDTCASYAGGEIVWRYTATRPITLHVSVVSIDADDFGSFADLVLDVNDACPSEGLITECTLGLDDGFEEGEAGDVDLDTGDTVYIYAAPYFSSDCTRIHIEVDEVP